MTRQFSDVTDRNADKPTKKTITVKEEGKTYVAHNPAEHITSCYLVDEKSPKEPGLIYNDKNGVKKCDFLILNKETKAAYFIELKGGKKMKDAYEQLIAGAEALDGRLKDYPYKYFRVVAKKVPNTYDSPTRKLLEDIRKKYRQRHIIDGEKIEIVKNKSIQLDEYIS